MSLPFSFSDICAKPLKAKQAPALSFKIHTSVHLEQPSIKVIKYFVLPFDCTRIGSQISEWIMSRISVLLLDVFGSGVIFLQRQTYVHDFRLPIGCFRECSSTHAPSKADLATQFFCALFNLQAFSHLVLYSFQYILYIQVS